MGELAAQPKSATRLDSAIADAVSVISDSNALRHEHSERCIRLLKPILYPDEYTVLEVKQSRSKSIAPKRIIATNKRLIIAKPSFWSLRIGRNIFASTKYETIPYKHILSITLSTGMFLSTINMRTDLSKSTDEEEIQGLSTDHAKTIFLFLHKLTESLEEYNKEESKTKDAAPVKERQSNSIGMEKARRLVKQKGTKFVWLGVEPIDYVIDGLCVEKENVIKIGMDELEKQSNIELKKLEECVFVSYDDTMATHVSKYLTKFYGINSYILEGGIEAQLRAFNS